MKIKCKNCLPKDGIEIPEFIQSDKMLLTELKINSPIKAIKYLVDDFNLSHRDAKYVVTHINKHYGKCNHCQFDKLNQEYLICPKYKALNLNWRIH